MPDVRTRILTGVAPAAAAGLPFATGFGLELDAGAPDLPPINHIAVLGDSVAWGQGLLEQQKMHTLLALAVSRDGRTPTVHLTAHSGATIGVGGVAAVQAAVPGEVPRARPTILAQCASIPAEDAAVVDLVIVNGGINDVDIRFILSPFTDVNDLADTTARACGTDLAVLLHEVLERFPAARVVVLTYYPMLSALSRFSWGREFLEALGAPPPTGTMMSDRAAHVPLIWERIVANCAVFHAASTTAITAAVAAVNAQQSTPRVAVADPGFTAENAALAPDPWLFAVNWDLSPQDLVALDRRQACDLFEPDVFRRQQCYRASAGHPNARGAQRYAGAILHALARLAAPSHVV
jgi:lysophospholipase L1-like esterase